ncbi:MAG: hypothetical protein ABSA81_10595 [Candidatus Bathyarchaeia archaeon]
MTLGRYGNARILGASAFLQIQRARRRRKEVSAEQFQEFFLREASLLNDSS